MKLMIINKHFIYKAPFTIPSDCFGNSNKTCKSKAKNNKLPSYINPPKPPMKKEYEMMYSILNNCESYSHINQECEKAELRMLIDYIEDYIKLKK